MEQICPRCKTTSYQNPNMKLMVNVCGHKMCEACVDSVFGRPSATCPECGIVLRRNQYRLQQFEDSYIEKEVEIRKKILKDYNKCEEDFNSLTEYNDYLEEIETIIYNFANGIDVETTRIMVDKYRKDNQDSIVKNRQRQLRDEQYVKSKLEYERQEIMMRKRRVREEELETIKNRKRFQESLLDELISSDRPADQVFAEARAVKKIKEEEDAELSNVGSATTSLFSKAQFQEQKGSIAFEPLPMETGSLYTYEELIIESFGPRVPDMTELEDYGYLKNVRQLDVHNLAGGFLPAHACQKALQEALSCLTLSLQDR